MITPYYDDGTVTLYLGDMREVLPVLGITADLIVADPPYAETSLEWDRWPDDWPLLARETARSMWCFGSLRMFLAHGAEFSAAGWKLSHDVETEEEVRVVWEKHNGTSFVTDRFKRVHEIAAHWYQGRWGDVYHQVPRTRREGPDKSGARRVRTPHTGEIGAGVYRDDGTRVMRSVIKVKSVRGLGRHPDEKPLGILTPLIEYACPPGGLVLDPFAGSGSTLEAARLTGRRAIGIERHEPYIEAAARRLAQALLEIA